MRTIGDGGRGGVLMVAYTNYESDPRVIRAAEAAAEARFPVDVIALRRPGQPPVEVVRGVRVHRVAQERYRGRSRARYLLAYGEFFARTAVLITRLHAARRHRVIHVHNMPDVLVFAALIPRLLGAKVILDIHDPMPETLGSKFASGGGGALERTLLALERASVRFAQATITVSEPVKNEVLVKHGYRPDAIGVVTNFADDELFRPGPYPAIGDRVRFAFHGTILERNGLRTLVEAVSLARHRDRLAVRIIGDGDFSARLTELIQEHGVADVVEFERGVHPLHAIPGLLADCHAGVVPLDMSRIANYALPLKLVEYTCLGLPSISVRSAAIDFYLRPDECMFFDAGDAKALAEHFDRVVEEPACLQEYRVKALAARERLLWSTEKARYIAMLRDLAGRAAGQRGSLSDRVERISEEAVNP
jgi:glycosyltransferase involved in cell wall biosynthesis